MRKAVPAAWGKATRWLSNTPGVLVAVKTADCIPILIVDARTRAVAAVHAGWRGTAKNIVAHAIAEMEQKILQPGRRCARCYWPGHRQVLL